MRRVLVFFAALLLIVDLLGALPLWPDEIARRWTAAFRLPVDVIGCTAGAAAECSMVQIGRVQINRPCCKPQAVFISTYISAPLYGIATFGGLIAAIILHAHGEAHEWYFAVESGGVLCLLAAWMITWHVSRRAHERAARREQGDVLRIAT